VRHGTAPSAQNITRFLRIYEDDLPASLPRRQGRVMPQVREILTALHGRADWVSLLLTGNTRRGGGAKLRHYGLDGFFAEGAFSDGTATRAEIAHVAAGLVVARHGATAIARTVVIGDTVHDITCARAAGLRCLAVATGGATLAELETHAPDAAVAELPPPAQFVRLIESICARSSGAR
jgi:phosphoglycolate phosphatase-like HAD superfamily hydrolase